MRRITMLSAGLLFVHATSNAQVPTLTRDFSIGCESCSGPLQFGNIWEVAVSAKGDILVVDRDAPMLRMFDATGKPVWQAGRRGRGPGEYSRVLRAALLPDGTTSVVDMSGMRVTELSPTQTVARTTALSQFPTTASINGASIVTGAEGPRGTLTLMRIRDGVATPLPLPADNVSNTDITFRNTSIASAQDGTIAIVANNEQYRILRIGPHGTRLADITRNIERVRRTPAEESALRVSMGRGAALVAAERKETSGRSTGSAPVIPNEELSLKPHVTVDGLRYDGAGRLWVRTMRGDENRTVFDVFSSTGAFLGSVTLPQAINVFGIGATWLVVAGENADGSPQVTRWTIR